MKQFAEEKFSATSLSATNVKGTNAKSKAAKNYNELYSNTPIRFGNMEINNFDHIGAEAVIQNLMLHSISPHGRKLVEQMYTCDPYHIDIKLDMNSKNRMAEIVNTYLKSIGLRLVFEKIPKYKYKPEIFPIEYVENPEVIDPFVYIPDDVEDVDKYMKEIHKMDDKINKNKKSIDPFKYYAIDEELHEKIEENNRKFAEYKDLTPRERYEKYKKEMEEGN